MHDDQRSLAVALAGDGRALIKFCGLCLGLSGLFAVFQSITGHFLPHDIAFLKMQPEELCGINECRVVHFMIHDRISFGGALVAIAVLYLWLAEFPLRQRESWAWWTLVISGVTGFGSFLTYLGYGYLDTWHGAATLVLLPCFIGGVWMTRPKATVSDDVLWSSFWHPAIRCPWQSAAGCGTFLVMISSVGMIGAGATIQWIGMTDVFVQTDLEFMGVDRDQLNAINPRLVPLIAHDRAGFGGAVLTAGLLTLASIWFGRPSRALWQALALAGFAGWTTAVFVHPAIGYTDIWHLAPAVAGAVLLLMGLLLLQPSMWPGFGIGRKAT
ncbi:MAG: hypothetical protein ACK58L_07665 [Planctomycetota bacterium]